MSAKYNFICASCGRQDYVLFVGNPPADAVAEYLVDRECESCEAISKRKHKEEEERWEREYRAYIESTR